MGINIQVLRITIVPVVKVITAVQIIRTMPVVDSTTGTNKAIINKAHTDMALSGEATDHPTDL